MKSRSWVIAISILLFAGYFAFVNLKTSYLQKNSVAPRLVIKARRAMLFDIPITYALTIDRKTVEGLPRGIGDQPEWSRDGRWVAFSTMYSGDLYDSEVFLMPSQGGKKFQVTETHYGVFEAAWSYDNQHIVYEVSRKIYILDVGCIIAQEGTLGCQLSPIYVAQGSSPDWSPTEDLIVFVAVSNFYGGYDVTARVLIKDLKSDQTYDITPENEGICLNPRWSPDGRKIVMNCEGTIYLVSSDGKIESVFSKEDIGWGRNPRWAPDGKAIVFIGEKGDDLGEPLNVIWNFEGTLTSKALFVIDIDGKNLTRITNRSDEDILWFTWWMPESP